MADKIISVCSGIGGLDLGMHRAMRSLGYTPRTVCYVEREAYPAAVLVKQIQEGNLDECPIWLGDLRGFPAGSMVGANWICGGYPCQAFSLSGLRRGFDDSRAIWPGIVDIIDQVLPGGVFFENVYGHISLGLFRVLCDLERRGFKTEWGIYTAEEIGAPHLRKRVFILGMQDHKLADSKSIGLENGVRWRRNAHQWPSRPRCPQGSNEPRRTTICGLAGNAHGVSPGMDRSRADRVRAIGNAVVPQVAEKAFLDLHEQLIRQWGKPC